MIAAALRPSLFCRLAIGTALAVAFSVPALAAQDEAPDDTKPSEIVVTGQRGSIIKDIAPIVTLDADAIAATGASTMSEFLRAIRSTTQSADGSDPIFLLNGQRTSGYQDIGSLPPEAIDKVEVLPEPAALKFGYPPSRRVVNFITKRRFSQTEARATFGAAMDGGSSLNNQNFSITRLRQDRRLSVSLERRHTGSLLQSARDIDPDPDVFFDSIGNITGADGGEIDPALSGAAGQVVTVAPVPAADPTSLGSYVPDANRPRLFDIGPYRTLAPENDGWKAETVLADKLGSTLSGSLSLLAERSRDRTLVGPAAATLTIPATNPFSPFATDVVLQRYLTEADLLRFRQTTTTLRSGGVLRGVVAGWRWDLTTSLDQKLVTARNESGIDLDAVATAIDGGANPFGPFDPDLLGARVVDHVRQRTRTSGAKGVITNTPLRLPAGDATLTATAEVERLSARSSTRGTNPFELDLARTRSEGGVAIDVPIASKDEQVLPFLGNLSFNASATARNVTDIGGLYDRTFGLAWGPLKGLQVLAQVKTNETAPPVDQLSTPEVTVENYGVFDFRTGRTEVVTLTQGGNRDLLPQRKHIRSIGFSAKPFPSREIRINATFEDTTIRNQTGNILALTPEVEELFPERVERDDDGNLVAVTIQPLNFYRQRQQVLNITLAANGPIGPKPPEPKQGEKPKPRPNFWAGIGPSIKFTDRLELRRGAPALDLLDGGTITGWGTPGVYGYFYGGVNYRGNGISVDGWFQGSNRVRSDNPASDLYFSPIFKMNLSAYIGVHGLLQKDWARNTQFRLEVSNLTNARQHVRNRNGDTPSRFQLDYMDPIGRTVKATLRKQF
jgi:iron complex outermembrane receptor protein